MFDDPADLLEKIRLGEDSYLELKAVRFAGEKMTGPRADDPAHHAGPPPRRGGGREAPGHPPGAAGVNGRVPMARMGALSGLAALLAGTVALAVLPAAAAAAIPPEQSGSASAPPFKSRVGSPSPRPRMRAARGAASGGATFRRYQQTVGGVPVLGAQTVVGEGLVLDRRRAGLAAPPAATISRDSALRAAQAATGIAALDGASRAALYLLPVGRGRLVWRALVSSRVPGSAWEVLVDARSGAIVRRHDVLDHADGRARLFDPNPVKELRALGNLTDAHDSSAAVPEILYRAQTLPGLIQGPCPAGSLTTIGPFVRAVFPQTIANEAAHTDGHGPDRSPCVASGDFSGIRRHDTPHDAGFEALMAYFHIDRAQRYIQSLGFLNINNRQILARANQYEVDNSDYNPVTRQLNFGVGGVDDAEDGDVILHEYGHAIQDNQAPGVVDFNVGEAGAIGEGFSDYFAASVSATYAPAGPFDVCYSAWDNIDAESDCLRRVDSNLPANARARRCITKYDDLPEAHCYGEAWSGALWRIRSTLGGAKTDKIVLQSHFGLPDQPGFFDAAQSMLAADRRLFRGRDVSFLARILGERNLLREPDNNQRNSDPLPLNGRVIDYADSSRPIPDCDDVYHIYLRRGRRIVIRIAARANLDLFVYAPGTRNVSTTRGVLRRATSRSGHETLRFRAPRNGRYYVDVYARGASTYAMTTRRG